MRLLFKTLYQEMLSWWAECYQREKYKCQGTYCFINDSKAFDMLWHNELLEMLEKLNFAQGIYCVVVRKRDSLGCKWLFSNGNQWIWPRFFQHHFGQKETLLQSLLNLIIFLFFLFFFFFFRLQLWLWKVFWRLW